MTNLRGTKNKLHNSVFTDEESPNFSYSKHQPRKTMVLENQQGILSPSQNIRSGVRKQFLRIKAPSDQFNLRKNQKYSTPLKNGPCTSKSCKSPFYTSSDDSSDENATPFLEYVSAKLVSTNQELLYFQNREKTFIAEIEFLKNELKLSEKKKTETEHLLEREREYNVFLKEKLKCKEINDSTVSRVNCLERSLKGLCDSFNYMKNSLTEYSFSKSSSLSQSSFLRNEDPAEEEATRLNCRIACLLCPGKICKNASGFNLHFGKKHKIQKEKSFNDRKKYSIQVLGI